MATNFKEVIDNIKKLSPDERALVAHCLISSLETQHDDDVDEAWAHLAESATPRLFPGKLNQFHGMR